MGMVRDLADAVKLRLNDPPVYVARTVQCAKCRGNGICAVCLGTPPRYIASKVVAVLLAIGGLYIGIRGVSNESIVHIIVSLILIVVGSMIALWACLSKCECVWAGNPGRCVKCDGSGSVQENVQTGGINLFEALDRTHKATQLSKSIQNGPVESVDELHARMSHALALNPDHCAANAVMGMVRYSRGEYQLALFHLSKAETREPRNMNLKHALSATYDAMGNEPMAQLKFMEAVSLGSKAANRQQMLSGLGATAGAVAAGGIAAVLIGIFLLQCTDIG